MTLIDLFSRKPYTPDLACPNVMCGCTDFIAATPTVRVKIEREMARPRQSGVTLRCIKCNTLFAATPAGCVMIHQQQAEQRKAPGRDGDEVKPPPFAIPPQDQPWARRAP